MSDLGDMGERTHPKTYFDSVRKPVPVVWSW